MSVFDKIYADNAWEYGSGQGSIADSTIEYRLFLEKFIQMNSIRTVVDLGCGDWQFSRHINWSNVSYTGIDAAKVVVEHNKSKFAKDNIKFLHFNGSYEVVPNADLLLCKDVIQHLSNSDIEMLMDGIRGKFRYALITNCAWPQKAQNININTGDFRPLDLRKPPFNLPGAVILSFSEPFTDTRQYWKKDVLLLNML